MPLTERHVQQIMSGDRTVYFLGAGASNASSFELPTMDRFFRNDGLTVDDFPDLHKFIKHCFPRMSIDELSLEDIITYLELGIDRFGSFGKRADPYLYAARDQFNDYVRKRLTYGPVNGSSSCPQFEKIFQHLKPKDTVITLNYDLVTENTLGADDLRYDKMVELLSPTLRTTAPVGVHEWDFENGWYLKLHGSISWCFCPNPNCVGHQFMTVLERRQGDIPPFCNSCGYPIEMAIVPPTMNKAFGKYPRLGAIWSLARRELAAATSIVLIGISLRPSDYYLSWLIKTSCLGKENAERLVVLVDKDGKLIDRVEKLIGKRPVYCESLDSYISALSKMGHARGV